MKDRYTYHYHQAGASKVKHFTSEAIALARAIEDFHHYRTQPVSITFHGKVVLDADDILDAWEKKHLG